MVGPSIQACHLYRFEHVELEVVGVVVATPVGVPQAGEAHGGGTARDLEDHGAPSDTAVFAADVIGPQRGGDEDLSPLCTCGDER